MTLLWTATIDVSLILAMALGALALLRGRSAALRHWVMTAAVGCALLMPLLEWSLPAWELPLSASRWTTTVVSPGVLARLETAVDEVAAAGGANASAGRIDVPTAAVAIWAAGALFAFSTLLAGLARIGRLARSADRVINPAWLTLAAGVARAHGVRRSILLLQSREPAMVVTWGAAAPRVLLPSTAPHWTLERLRVVLCHEIAHIRRGDWVILIAAAVLRAIYWFNPLVWIAAGVLRRESERACDDLVLDAGVSGPDYAAHLVAVARDAAHLRAWPAAAIAQPSSLEGRVHAMLNTTLDRTPVTGIGRAAAAVLLAAAAVTLASASRDAAAQTGIGTIKATLYDQAGGLLPSVAVEALHVDSGRTVQATTDRTGSFALENVPTGVYQLTMSLPGFATVRSSVDLRAGDALQRNVMLPLGSIEETITITGPRQPGSPSPQVTTPAFRPAREIPQPRAATAAGGIGGNIRQPRKLVDKKPIFPVELGGSSATVVLRGRIGMDGYLVDLKDVSPTQAHPAFVESLLTAVGQWEFDPTLLNGAPVDTPITITGRFQSAK